MHFAVCNETFQDWPLERGFAFAVECGYTGVEIAPFTIATYATVISSVRRREIRRQIEAAGLEVVGLHWLLAKTQGLHLTSPDESVRRKTAEYLGELARLCAELGGRVLVLGSPQQRNILPGVTPEQATGYALEVFQTLVPVLEKTGVVLALEPLGPQETNFMVTTAETVAIVERLGSAHVRLHLDCKAMSSEPVPVADIIRQYRSLMVHFHANDPNRQGPGFGKLDFVPIFGALQEIGYDGWVSVEVFDYAPGVERLARESIAYMRKCLESLADG
jgi:sugar phosphate isomerase/epimerase